MIQIHRPPKGPKQLQRLGAKQTALDCAAYDVCPSDYASGKARFDHRKKKYYSSKAVKRVLVQTHNSKCCYCEKKFTPANLHVEHFRPKAGARQSRAQKDPYLPGYYWLKYEWSNLLLSCHDCNNLCKGNLFPLTNPKARARSHNDDPGAELPLFVDPAKEDPRNHVVFDDDRPRGLTRRGRATINGLQLGRKALRDDRQEKLANIHALCIIVAAAAEYPTDVKLRAEAEKARQCLSQAADPVAQFSSMARDHLARCGW